jgi:hypothetical protein
MNTKLTLTLKKEIIDQAKKYASDKGRSLSEMVENYFKYLTSQKDANSSDTISPRIQKLRGIIKVDKNFDYNEVLNTTRNEKHGA